MKILIVDDEEISLSSVKRVLRWRGIRNVETCASGKEAIGRIREGNFDIVLLDLLMPEVDGFQVLEAAKPHASQTEFIILTAVNDIPATVKAIRLGAYDYIVKPVDNELLFLSIERAYERKSLLLGITAPLDEQDGKAYPAFAELVTKSPRMRSLISYAQIMALSGNPVLITGESGTGKELMARAIHQAGPYPEGPFIAVNVSAIPATMFESHFFGHVKGAFTGADAAHRGFFEQAHGGTLFLDEIGELPTTLQTKFLRVLEEKSFVPLGGSQTVRVDVRFISATNSDLSCACREGKFRIDLFYRIKSAHINLPPLRERREDIPLLASHFLKISAKRHGRDVRSFSPEAMELLTGADFPGNVRELAQTVENAVLLADSQIIQPHHLGMGAPVSSPVFSRRVCSLRENYETHIAYVLSQSGGDRGKAAQHLGITLRQLQRVLSEMKKDPRWAKLLNEKQPQS